MPHYQTKEIFFRMNKNEINIVALVPMKGNSERVPNKNLKMFNGKPLYHSIIKSLQLSKYITKIVVNTDSQNIKSDIGNNFPFIELVERPADIQGDFVSMNEIIAYDLKRIDGDIFIQTHSTNPLITAETIDQAIEMFISNTGDNDSVFSVTRLQSRFYWKDGLPINHNPEVLLRTQDLDPLFEENSNFYIFTKKSFSDSGNKRIGKKPLMFEVDKIQAIDIDDLQDFKIAEIIERTLSNL